MKPQVVTVYLDTQDYSNLANPIRHAAEPDLPVLLESLRKFKEDGSVRFVYSAVSVAESLPMSISNVEQARRQVRLLRELCGQCALLNHLSLTQREVHRLCRHGDQDPSAVGARHDWLPPALGKALDARRESKTVEQDARQIVAASSARNMSSKLRALAMSIAIKEVRRLRLERCEERIRNGDFFFIKPEFHKVLLRASVGEATEADTASALLESWGDVEWVVNLYERAPEVANWFRDAVRDVSRQSADALRRFIARLEQAEDRSSLSARGWRERRDQYLLTYISEACKLFGCTAPDISIDKVRESCPGIYCEAGVIWSHAWAYATGGMKKEVRDSSSADAMHAMYAPYVDVFRADRSMTPHVIAALPQSGTTVVGDRRRIPDVIAELLVKRRFSSSDSGYRAC